MRIETVCFAQKIVLFMLKLHNPLNRLECLSILLNQPDYALYRFTINLIIFLTNYCLWFGIYNLCDITDCAINRIRL